MLCFSSYLVCMSFTCSHAICRPKAKSQRAWGMRAAGSRHSPQHSGHMPEAQPSPLRPHAHGNLSRPGSRVQTRRRPAIPRYGFQLLGFDYMLDSKLWPWLMEVNSAPSIMAEVRTAAWQTRHVCTASWQRCTHAAALACSEHHTRCPLTLCTASWQRGTHAAALACREHRTRSAP